jgi:hypothetical protein
MFCIQGCTGLIDQLLNSSSSLNFGIEIPMSQYHQVFSIRPAARNRKQQIYRPVHARFGADNVTLERPPPNRVIWSSPQENIYIHYGWVHTCNVTAYRNTISWQCGRDLCSRNVSKVGYAVTLRACSVCCRYLAVASKEWYGYGRSMCRRATSYAVTLQVCNHPNKAKIRSSYRNLDTV